VSNINNKKNLEVEKFNNSDGCDLTPSESSLKEEPVNYELEAP